MNEHSLTPETPGRTVGQTPTPRVGYWSMFSDSGNKAVDKLMVEVRARLVDSIAEIKLRHPEIDDTAVRERIWHWLRDSYTIATHPELR